MAPDSFAHRNVSHFTLIYHVGILMKRLAMFLAAATVITAVGCTPKEEPKPIPQEMPAIVTDTVPAGDTLKSVEESKTTTTTKKTTVVKKTTDGSGTVVTPKPSRDIPTTDGSGTVVQPKPSRELPKRK